MAYCVWSEKSVKFYSVVCLTSAVFRLVNLKALQCAEMIFNLRRKQPALAAHHGAAKRLTSIRNEEITTLSPYAGAFLAPPPWRQGSLKGAGQRKIFVVHVQKAVFDIKPAYTVGLITKYSSYMSDYTQQKFHLGQWWADFWLPPLEPPLAYMRVFTARRYASAVYAVVLCLFVRPPVRTSVTSRFY